MQAYDVQTERRSLLKSIYVQHDLKDFAIRPRESRDTDALLEMFTQPRCRHGMVMEPFRSAQDIDTWFDANGTANFEVVATLADKAIGYAGLFPKRGDQSHVGLLCLFVHDSLQCRGIGTVLLTALLATADILLRLNRVELLVFCDNHHATYLYRKFGFVVEGRHKAFARRGQDLVDAFTMARIAPAV
jgi:L-phenylalanine/L-methionine N-acetyltransferase